MECISCVLTGVRKSLVRSEGLFGLPPPAPPSKTTSKSVTAIASSEFRTDYLVIKMRCVAGVLHFSPSFIPSISVFQTKNEVRNWIISAPACVDIIQL